MKASLWKYMGIGAFIVLALIDITLIYIGVGNVLGSIILIVLCYFLGIALIKLAVRVFNSKPELFYNLKISMKVLVVLWMGAELLFRYGIGTYQSYGEKNGSWIYVSPYLLKESSWSNLWVEHQHVYQPNLQRHFHFEEYSYNLTTNRLGLRNSEISNEKPSDVYRIVAIGDSFTEGRGASQNESWPATLHSNLNDGRVDQKFEVINAGISGSDPIFELHFLETKLIKLDPDMVIMAVNSGDIDDLVIRGGAERYDEDGTLSCKNGPWWDGLYANSFVFRHVVHDVLDYNLLLNANDAQEGFRENAKKDVQQAISDFIAMAKSNGIHPMIVLHPTSFEFEKGKTELDFVFEEVRNDSNLIALNIKKNTGVPSVDQELREQLYWPIDQHHTAEGYLMMAGEIYNAIEYAGVLK